MSVLAPVRDYIESLLHVSARQDALMAARHRAFIAPRLLGGLTALAAFPAYLALGGAPSILEAVVFGWVITPIVIAWYLSRTGQFDRAHLMSSLALTSLITFIASQTGGAVSLAAMWLVLVPLEAALSTSRRVVIGASVIAFSAACLLLVLGITDVLPHPSGAQPSPVIAALAIVAGTMYAAGLALGAESLARTGYRLRSFEEARYRLLARNMTDVITRHRANGTILFVSPAAEPLFGVPLQDLHGHGLFDRVHVGDRPAYLAALTDAACGAASSVEFRVRRDAAKNAMQSGSHFIWIEMRCRPLDRKAFGETGSQGCDVVAVMRDITERKNQQRVIEDAREDAERANAAKSRFLATMSHELRTPLNAIIGFSDMLLHEQTMNIDAAHRHDYAQLINDSGQHLLSVVNGILDMSRIETGNFEITAEPFDVQTVVENCCDLLALRAREGGIDLVVRRSPGLPEIVADKRAVKQILLNLLSNAIKFTHRGGQVTVSSMLEQDMLALTVEDNGVGIPEDDLPRLGNPFFQVRGSYDRPHDGTGLGLSIVKGLLALHRGDMEIRSSVGKGTRVTIRLPMKGAVAFRDTTVESRPQPGSQVGIVTNLSDLKVKRRA